jgi:hypothetical protein
MRQAIGVRNKPFENRSTRFIWGIERTSKATTFSNFYSSSVQAI